jgi:hypothetical protein
VLLLGAAAAGYAALSKKSRSVPVRTATVAQVPPPAVPAPSVPAPGATTPLPGTTTTKPPKIPLKAATPLPAATTPAVTPSTPQPSTGGSTPSPSTNGSGGAANQPEAILLDTDAASTYDPYAYPATWFGDPSLAIDGDTTTGWSAQVNPATAPALAEGLLLDLKSQRRLSAVKLVTSTPGITVQVYGSAAKSAPTSITDPAWVTLSRSIDLKKRHARLGLRNKGKRYRFVAVWLSRAPASALGTPEAPGKVTLDEIELFPAA